MSSNFQIIAHRGLCHPFAENSIQAIEEGFKNKECNFVEIDVHFSKDKKVFVIHDLLVDRTAKGYQGRVDSFLASELVKMDIGDGNGIPTFDKVLDITMASKSRAKLLVEIKFEYSWRTPWHVFRPFEGLAAAVLEAIRAKKASNRVVIQSFCVEYLLWLKEHAPEISLHCLVMPWQNTSKLLKYDFDGYNPRVIWVSKSFIDRVHEKKKTVFIWTVDLEADIRWCKYVGADGVITNRVDRVAKALQTPYVDHDIISFKWKVALFIMLAIYLIAEITSYWTSSDAS